MKRHDLVTIGKLFAFGLANLMFWLGVNAFMETAFHRSL